MVPNISKFKSDIWQICYSQSQKFQELGLTDNPYAKGGNREHIDPLTGEPRNSQPGYGNPYRSDPYPQTGYADNKGEGNSHRSTDRNGGQSSSNPRGSFTRGRGGWSGRNNDTHGDWKRSGLADLQDWPLQIKCEMNIPEWEHSLEEANIRNEYEDVIDGFKFGFDQGIPHHTIGNLKWLTPDNYFPMGAVVNGDGLVQPINDLSFPKNRRNQPSVNSFVNKDNFTKTWDDFNKVSRFFKQHPEPVHLALFDWEKAYLQIPTAMNQLQYLMVQDFSGNLLLDTRITFGGVAGCGSFGRPADAWKEIMLHHFNLITVFRWVDDNLFVEDIDFETNMEDIVKKSSNLGVLTNVTKNSPFQEEQKFIGFIWNGVDKTTGKWYLTRKSKYSSDG
ncbi:uncharacterized protein PGTG_21372 [Puccinia graminis f. sp. tritici CRL 75-36-700-3]|uniref:Reverse transcriptase domain-containing protein n=1 Tax=Puccinia graminis f. sp. tritici (strain CRL 75-36-700-3 / race SCCL) TaxID=418459 RepID=H6QRD2_PUCGT|nr:uncharacterized protein PGTG_21372 [Puccinia graminis f. sp. tritici CRL 75-36-700-3]EHS63221.1 hypothetical protein PGTG_21372 [Puccinia graminis f. sp. tritici CRL 75-36-700-3]